MELSSITSADVLIPSDETIAAITSAPFDEYGDNDVAPQPVNTSITPLTPTQQETNTAVQKMMDASELINKTIFVKVGFGSIGNSRKVSGAEVLETDADKSFLKVSKTLLDSPELDAIKRADGKMREWLYNTCLPFDMGIMLLPIGLVETAETRMKEYQQERQVLVENFIAAYPALCEAAAKQLGSLYKASEYPTVSDIKAKFVFKWQYTTFSVPGSLKNISQALFESEKEKAAKTMQAASEEITALMRETMLKLVSHLQNRLSPGDEGKPKILRESAVNNLMEFLNSFDMRNVTNDADLAAQVKKARELVSGTSAGALRNSDTLKTQVLSGLDGIMDSLTGLVEEKAGRKFRDEE